MSVVNNRIHTFFVIKEPGGSNRVVVWDTQDVSFGRARENDIAIDHVEISRRHAQFNCTGKNYVVQNLSTSNETLVNGETVTTHMLQSGDVVRIAEVELRFYQSTKDPVALGMPLEYASQLKDFAGPKLGADGDATVLGLVDTFSGSDEDFDVRPANEFAYDLHGIDKPGQTTAPRDLDQELEGFGLDDLEIPDAVAKPPPAKRAAGTPDFLELPDVEDEPVTTTLHVEIQGIEGELRQTLRALAGKLIELPPLKIKIRDADLD